MPKRNGIEAAQEIKKAWKEAVIIGVCAVRDKCIVDTFLKAGAEAVISKCKLPDQVDTGKGELPASSWAR